MSAQPSPPQEKDRTLTERVKAAAGLTAVAIGVIVVGIIALAAISKNTQTAATIASAAGGVIATIVGAFFGVKIGSEQSKKAQDGLKEESAKAQIYAAYLPPAEADSVTTQAQEAAENAVSP
ncbi:MAG TPA: hypothetical protein VNM38_04065 [Solirubrobacterales bacterium]|nr:hypothetical protein [Solirubrobacterales bacterium]